MFDRATILYMHVETPLHAGSGTGMGVVDLPIQRERVTGYPLVQSSGVKGKLRAEATDSLKRISDPDWDEKIAVVFGPDAKGGPDYAGALAPGDARLLLFPVRSLLGVFAWTTSRDVLARFVRDANATGQSLSWVLESPDENTVFVAEGNDLVADGRLVLEEFAFTAQVKPLVKDVAQWLAESALPQSQEYKYWRGKLLRSLVILPENAFRDFTQFSTEVVTRIKLKRETKTVEGGALWTEEHLPADTLLYAPVHATRPRKPGVLTPDDASGVLTFVKDLGLERIQLGGDETIGRGLVRLRWA